MNYSELSEPLYHGSSEAVREVNLLKSAPLKDFGRGFYTTNDPSQAEKFARLKAKRANGNQGYVSCFRFHNTNGLAIKHFSLSDEEWFDFVLRNRGYCSIPVLLCEDNAYDIVIGPVANDAVGIVLNLFVSSAYGDPSTPAAKEIAIGLLLAQKLHNQIFFGTELAISRLTFSEVYDVCLD